MGEFVPDEPTEEQRRDAELDSIRAHVALVSGEVVAWYLGAAAARLALDHGVSPAEAVRQMLAGGAFTDGDAWEAEAKNLRRLTRLTRARFVAAAVSFKMRDARMN